MESITDLGGLLRYGAIGLGLALSVLAFLLLRTEQKQAKPRGQILTAVYVFMSFSLLLSVGGFVSEYVRSQATADERAIEELRAEVKAKTEELGKVADYRSEIARSRKTLFGLLESKEGTLKRLAELKPDSPDYPTVVQEIRRNLQQVDDMLRNLVYQDAH